MVHGASGAPERRFALAEAGGGQSSPIFPVV